MKLLLFLYIFNLMAAPVTLVRKNTGSGAEDIDYHCNCRRVNNTSGKDIMLPLKIAAEWASFYNNLPAGVTAPASCMLSGAGPPTTNYTNVTVNCEGSTNAIIMDNIDNAPYNLSIDVPVAFTTAPQGCTARLDVTNGPSTALVAGINSVQVCSNQEVSIYVRCTNEAAHGPYTFTVEGADTFDVEFFFVGFGCGV